MDPSNMESRDGLLKGQSGLQTLLCRTIRQKTSGNGKSKIPQRICRNAPSGLTGSATEVENSFAHLRELNVRPVSRGSSSRVHPGSIPDHEKRALACLSNFDQAFRQALRAPREVTLATQCLGRSQCRNGALLFSNSPS